MKHNIKLIAFDMDDTLTEGMSWNLFHRVGGVTADEQITWRTRYINHELNYAEWINLIETKYIESNKTRSDFLRVVRTIPFKPDAKKVIRTLMSCFPIHIVSSSIDIYVEAVSRELSITDFHANHSFLYDSQDKFIKISYEAPEAEAKVAYLVKICNELHLNPESICFVGDSYGDLAAFEYTKRGILVGKGSSDLEHAAWKKVETLSKILSILI